jgi:dienelactone hydrolase
VRRHVGLVAAQLVVGLELLVLALTSDVSTAGRVAGSILALLLSGALVTASLSARAAVRGIAATIAGVLGVASGAAIAPAWYVTSGLSTTVVVAAAALVAGLCLLVAGAVLLVRATPGWWRLLALPVAFVVLQFGVLPLAGAVYGTHPPRTPTSAPMPGGAERVAFESADGVLLVAWYTPSRDGATVILLPGSGGEKGSTLAHADVLARRGYGVLALDPRGTGESDGVGNAWGWHGPVDIAGAVDWLSARPGVDPDRIGALGLSMGGEEAITAAAGDPRLHAVVAEGVSARVPEDLAYLPSDATGIIERLEAEVMWAAADLMTDAPRPVALADAVADAAREPVLLIVGADDDEARAAPLLRRAAPDIVVWELPDTPHIGSLGRHPDEWERVVIGFLDRALGA